jgi:hypothetical protein
LNLFDQRSPAAAYLTRSFEQLATQGLGPGRGRARLEETRGATDWIGIPLSPRTEQARRVRVRFLTPTELKSGERVLAVPEFAALAMRAKDRVSLLRQIYGAGGLEMDHRGFRERAGMVRMTRWEGGQVHAERRSSRTGQVHGLGGFTGEAEYEGELAEFLPYLVAASYTGVGRQTVWGKGHIEVEKG